MNNTIKTPATVRELFRTANEVRIAPSKLVSLFDKVLGDSWPEQDTQEITLWDLPEPENLTTTEVWNPHLNEYHRPANIPAGFSPVDTEWVYFAGKKMEGPRWRIESEWSEADGFSLTFWATDDDSMTTEETRQYIADLLHMTSYITIAKNLMDAGTAA